MHPMNWGPSMLARRILLSLSLTLLAGSAQAVTKVYNSTPDNGLVSDFINTATNLCPPVQTSPGIIGGDATMTDDGTGTVTLNQLNNTVLTLIDLGPDQLTLVFGPGAFIFIDSKTTSTSGANHISNTTGIGAHGPSETDPGTSTEWGVTSGWTTTGRNFCVSSPVAICNNSNFAHGQTVPPSLNSTTFDLGTWNFDAEGDYSTENPYISATANGGLQNNRNDLRGAFQGSALPALPLVGFDALALSLAAIGIRATVGRK